VRRAFIILGLLLAAAIVGGVFVSRYLNRPVPLPSAPQVASAPKPPVVISPKPPVLTSPKSQVPAYRHGERIGEIAIPRLKLAVPVFEGDDEATLKRGAGHVPHTALPGQPGNICIAAHRDKFFRSLRFIKPHDEIVLKTSEGPVRYSVNSISIVKPTDVQVLLPAPDRDLTLVTCYPFYYLGHAPKRFIVHAAREPA
jgi:sortase A